jgi:hypothetical protein
MRNPIFALLFVAACDSSSVKHDPHDADTREDADPPVDLLRSSEAAPPHDAAPIDGGGCQAGKTCKDCGDHRQCTPAACGDAVCGACEMGFVENLAKSCVAAQTPLTCQAQNREFTAVGMLGYCGACVLGTQETNGRCFDMGSGACAQEADCSDGKGCLQIGSDDDPQCRAAPCPVGQSWDRSFAARGCLDCSGRCGDSAWPVTDRSGNCYCRSTPGTFYNSDVFRTDACDADGDGWLNEELLEELKLARGTPLDYTILLNVRCPIPVFDTVELRNEWNQPPPPINFVTDLGLTSSRPVPMYEAAVNDRGVPGYPALLASSVNSLTKACYSDTLDLNLNGIADVQEDQASKTADWFAPYQRLTYFAELYEARYERPRPAAVVPCLDCTGMTLPGTVGTLVIRERSRCSDIPFSSSGSSYWRECTRRRDDGFRTDNRLGYDFAAYECGSNLYQSCSYSWPPPVPNPPPTVLPPPAVSPSPVPGTVAPHGLCDSDVQPTGPWRGMTHYSQFRCAKIVSSFSAGAPRDEVLEGDPAWKPQSCALSGQPSASPAPGTLPRFTCSTPAVPPRAPSVTWLMRNFQSYNQPSDYKGGCIDEGAEWGLLCPHDRSTATGELDAFGELTCGPACARGDTFYVDSFWMCLQPTTTAFTDSARHAFEGDGYALDGDLPVGSGDGKAVQSPSCGDGGAGSCYQLQ